MTIDTLAVWQIENGAEVSEYFEIMTFIFILRPTGGIFATPPLIFQYIYQSYEWIATKFSVFTRSSIWHILTKKKPATSDG